MNLLCDEAEMIQLARFAYFSGWIHVVLIVIFRCGMLLDEWWPEMKDQTTNRTAVAELHLCWVGLQGESVV